MIAAQMWRVIYAESLLQLFLGERFALLLPNSPPPPPLEGPLDWTPGPIGLHRNTLFFCAAVRFRDHDHAALAQRLHGFHLHVLHLQTRSAGDKTGWRSETLLAASISRSKVIIYYATHVLGQFLGRKFYKWPWLPRMASHTTYRHKYNTLNTQNPSFENSFGIGHW